MWTLYILHCADGTFYTGITTDLERRVEEHNTSRKGAKYTRSRRPVKCVYRAEFADRSAASKAECAMKKLTKEQKKGLIEEWQPAGL